MVLAAAAGTLLLPPTRSLFLWIVSEDRPVELLTFFLFIAGGFFSLRNAVVLRQSGTAWWVVAYHTAFGLGLVLVGMEEAAWGQRWLGFETPAWFREINAQGEVTLHNVQALQGRSELFRLAFGLAGLIGVALWRYPRLRAIAAPPVLTSWLVLISLHAAIDTYNDFEPLGRRIDFGIARSSEIIELLIAAVGFLYGWLHGRILRGSQRLR